MGALAQFFLALAGPMATRVLTALGLGLVSYAGMTAVVNQAISAAQSAWGGVAGPVATLVAMSGANTAMAVICGGIVARTALLALKKVAPV